MNDPSSTSRPDGRPSPAPPITVTAPYGAVAERPWVLLDVDCDDGAVTLVLTNVGAEPAYRVEVAFDRELAGPEVDRPISSIRLFRGLSLLRPGRELRVFWHTARHLLGRMPPPTFGGAVTYRDSSGRVYKEAFAHDLAIFGDLPASIGRRD